MDHVQRAQADVASREERIRLIQEEIAAHKSEIETIVKQARDATQQVGMSTAQPSMTSTTRG